MIIYKCSNTYTKNFILKIKILTNKLKFLFLPIHYN